MKVASRSVFFDETGKRVRTKKEITGEDGQIRKGCTVIKKGEVYESHLFTTKDTRFKGEPFLREIKEVYTELINRHISDPEQHLKVFDKNSVYLPTKKIGKNNPKRGRMEQDSGYGVIIRYLRSKDFRSQADRDTRKGEPVYQKQGLASQSVPQYREQGKGLPAKLNP